MPRDRLSKCEPILSTEQSLSTGRVGVLGAVEARVLLWMGESGCKAERGLRPPPARARGAAGTPRSPQRGGGKPCSSERW